MYYMPSEGQTHSVEGAIFQVSRQGGERLAESGGTEEYHCAEVEVVAKGAFLAVYERVTEGIGVSHIGGTVGCDAYETRLRIRARDYVCRRVEEEEIFPFRKGGDAFEFLRGGESQARQAEGLYIFHICAYIFFNDSVLRLNDSGLRHWLRRVKAERRVTCVWT